MRISSLHFYMDRLGTFVEYKNSDIKVIPHTRLLKRKKEFTADINGPMSSDFSLT